MLETALKAVLFDLDGVLVETSKYHAQAWADLVRSLGYEPPVDLEEQVRGISRMESLKIALGEHASQYSTSELEELASRKNACYLEAIKTITPADLYPGALELFASLKAAGIKIVLGSASKNVRQILAGLQISEHFDAIADGYTYKHGKPHPDVFLTGAKMVGATAQECIVVEDAAAGINAALDGGFVAVGMGTFDSLCHAHLFVRSLCELNAERLTALHARYHTDAWTVTRDGIHPEYEGSLDTLFCIGNGRIGVRGHLAELPVGTMPGTFVAGFFDKVERPAHDVSKWGAFLKYWGVPELAQDLQIEACIVNSPDFLAGEWTIDGERIDFTTGQVHEFSRRLDMRSGMFIVEALWTSPTGKELRLTMRRFAHACHTNRVYTQYALEPLNFSGHLQVRAQINTETVTNLDYKKSDFIPQQLYTVTEVAPVGEQAVAVHVTGRSDGMEAAFATGLRLHNQSSAVYRVSCEAAAEVIADTEVAQDAIIYLDRVSCFALQHREANVRSAVQAEVSAALADPFNSARIPHTARWHQYWQTSDVQIEGNPDDQISIRFSIYHLLIAGPGDDSRVSIAAKSLTGAGYRGMVFWDTDIHMTPFFIFTQPEMARNLALFRYHTLDGAREKAAQYGFRGASYPWETGVSGREETEKWLKLITHQAHITADVAFALQQYVDATGDLAFYEDYAAEVLIDTARFWMSKMVADGDGFAIPDAGGPDEYHVVGDDSAYVNHLAKLNLRLADRAVQHLRTQAPAKLAALLARLGATAEEVAAFAPTAERIHSMQAENGLFEQCRGFFGLRDEFADEAHDPQNTQTVKQADVLMLLYLLPDQWAQDVLKVNWEYYEPRTVHASSLSHAVHGILAAELGIHEKAEAYMRRSLGMDLHDEMSNTVLGVHMAANGMNWSAMVRGFGGVRPQHDHLLIEPRLPARWQRLAFTLKWRGAVCQVEITQDAVIVTNAVEATQPLPISLYGLSSTLAPGEAITTPITSMVL